MNRTRVLLTKLSVRTSAKGRQYLSGWLGKASVVAFAGEPDKFGNDVWDLYLSEPEPRRPDDVGEAASAASSTSTPRQPYRERQERTSAEVARGHGADLDDGIAF